MSENNGDKDAAVFKRKVKDKKKQKDENSKVKKTRRHIREAQQAEAQEVPQIQEVKPQGDLEQSESAASLSPSAIIEMFHLQDEESLSSSSIVTTARYLVENETSGDFYQVRTRQRKQHAHFSDHVRYRRSSLVKAQQKVRDGSNKAENCICWTILQRDGEKALVVAIVGIVAGMCWMDALNLRSGNSSTEFDSFLCSYSAGSNRSRQNLFVLFNGVLIGLMRKLSQMSSYQEYKTLGTDAAAEITSYKLLQAATAFISTALIVLLVGSPSALRLSRSQQANAKWCEEIAPTSALFQNGVLVLQVCAVLNTTLITAAWLLVALQCSVTMSSSTANRSRIKELQEALSKHEKRICELKGTHLEDSSAEDLKTLIQLHQRAIELTEGMLVAKLQTLHRPTMAC